MINIFYGGTRKEPRTTHITQQNMFIRFKHPRMLLATRSAALNLASLNNTLMIMMIFLPHRIDHDMKCLF